MPKQQPTTQYHHYIPQFLLSRFSHSGILEENGDGRKRWPEKMLSAASLDEDSPKIVEVRVRKTFGEQDMYKDEFASKDQMRIEKALGRIEARAGQIIKKAVDAYENGHGTVVLLRLEKDILRKFQFVMKYRSPIFFKRFNHQTADGYNSNDRTPFLEYMKSKNFKRPLDVWFHDLMAIIDEPMDPAGNWITKLADRIFPGDALWIFTNVRLMHLAFVTPSNESEEFILTGNAFGIHEGPVSCSANRRTGELTITMYTEFHILNVISPKLMMLLRSNLMPEPFEDKDESVRKQREAELNFHAAMHLDPEHARSLLADLPVAKARNSYTVVKKGCILLAKGADGVPRARDTFTFSFFRLESRHAQMLNAVMLDQAHNTKLIVFNSKSALRKALEFYLSMPTQANGMFSMKTISELPDDPMLILFRKLEQVARLLGSDVKAKYHI
ncbi:hypothetical protein P153DRAFT_281296, partial [Dothidotthia symphoricarpi CBS 119687]